MFNKVLIKSVDKIRVHIAKQPKNTHNWFKPGIWEVLEQKNRNTMEC